MRELAVFGRILRNIRIEQDDRYAYAPGTLLHKQPSRQPDRAPFDRYADARIKRHGTRRGIPDLRGFALLPGRGEALPKVARATDERYCDERNAKIGRLPVLVWRCRK